MAFNYDRISFETFMCMASTTSRDDKAMIRVFMRLHVNIIGFEMTMYTNRALRGYSTRVGPKYRCF